MSANEYTPKPQIKPYDDAEADVKDRIDAIDRAIHASPAKFVSALEELKVEDASLQLSDFDPNAPPQIHTPAMLLTEFLRKRYDLDSEFDADTARAIAANGTIDALRQDKANRRAIKIEELKVYVGQVIDYNLTIIDAPESTDAEAS